MNLTPGTPTNQPLPNRVQPALHLRADGSTASLSIRV